MKVSLVTGSEKKEEKTVSQRCVCVCGVCVCVVCGVVCGVCVWCVCGVTSFSFFFLLSFFLSF